MKVDRRFHLTYCSNIHPGETWPEIYRNLMTFLPQVREKLGRQGPFGIGLRLSAQAALALEEPAALQDFQGFLQMNNFYVFTINGFPYGQFHRQRVKEEVYLPDWTDPLRLEYTNRLASLLARLMPADLHGSVSTAPGAFKPNIHSAADVEVIASNMLRHVRFLCDLYKRTGQTVSLAIEPEPCCLIETVDEAIRFFNDSLLKGSLLKSFDLSENEVRAHAGLCFDACHMAVEYEDPAHALERLRRADIRIFKFQISSALRFRSKNSTHAKQAFLPFAESTYLHQVVENDGLSLRRFADLPDAFESPRSPETAESEWRVHFHVPVFLRETSEGLSTTQDYLATLLRLLSIDPVCPYLEVETYTWDVLPPEYRTLDIATAIARELRWVVQRIEHE